MDYCRFAKKNQQQAERIAMLEKTVAGVRKFLTPEQLDLASGVRKRVVWSDAAVMIAVDIRYNCGVTGYEKLRALKWPLPCISVLNKRLQDIKMKPGILNESFKLLEHKAKSLEPNDCEAILLMDEIGLQARLDWDVSTKSVIGRATVDRPPQKRGKAKDLTPEDEQFRNLAKDAQVYLICGVKKRYKSVAAYDFTAGTFNGASVAQRIIEIIRKSRSCGINIRSLASDMGANNQTV